jgi:hypothetical protein
MLLSTLLLAGVTDAYVSQRQISAGLNHLRFGCSQITIERLDPLVNPGQFPTPHMHQVSDLTSGDFELADTERLSAVMRSTQQLLVPTSRTLQHALHVVPQMVCPINPLTASEILK